MRVIGFLEGRHLKVSSEIMTEDDGFGGCNLRFGDLCGNGGGDGDDLGEVGGVGNWDSSDGDSVTTGADLDSCGTFSWDCSGWRASGRSLPKTFIVETILAFQNPCQLLEAS